MIQFEQFTGGAFDTNCYLIHGPAGNVLIDAPQGADERFARERVDVLVLTHGHFDHVADAAAIQARHRCPIGCHPDTTPMVTDRGFFRRWGFELEIEPIEPGFFIEEPGPVELGGISFRILDVPGHCPGSICLYLPEHGILFGGDVLFRGGTGRWDLPGGDKDQLFAGIRSKILPLPAETRVLSGHGPATSVGHEMQTNPWLQF